MSIADKLLYLNETKRQLREAINAVFGTGLTEATPFREYANVEGLWNPRLLFLSGEQGAWYDPSDLSTLFQDAAGAPPVTADGDPVGLMLDKSGNGKHATQTVSAARPTYRTDGTLHWLEFDGVDDWLKTTSNTGISGDFSATGYAAYSSSYAGPGFPAIFSQNQGMISRGLALTIQGNCPALDVWSNRMIKGLPGLDSNPHIAGFTKTPGTLTSGTSLRIDGSVSIATLNGSDAIPNLVNNTLDIGRLDAYRHFIGSMYGVFLIDAVLNAQKLEMLEIYLAAKAGVTL